MMLLLIANEFHTSPKVRDVPLDQCNQWFDCFKVEVSITSVFNPLRWVDEYELTLMYRLTANEFSIFKFDGAKLRVISFVCTCARHRPRTCVPIAIDMFMSDSKPIVVFSIGDLCICARASERAGVCFVIKSVGRSRCCNWNRTELNRVLEMWLSHEFSIVQDVLRDWSCSITCCGDNKFVFQSNRFAFYFTFDFEFETETETEISLPH